MAIAFLKIFLLKKMVPTWAILALVAIGSTSFLIKGCADNRAIRELGGQVISLQDGNAELTSKNTALASENVSLKISENSLARSQNALAEQLATNDAACKKQLSDRERIAAIRAADRCVVTAVEVKPVATVQPLPEGEAFDPPSRGGWDEKGEAGEAEIEIVEVVSSETSEDIIYFFNGLFVPRVQP